MDLVSVIIPYFKKKKYIYKCLKSALKQSYKNLEIIIVFDDQDNTDLDYIKNLVNKDKRIRLLVNKKSLGAGFSRNKAIKISKGKFIAFLDADDYWTLNKLKIQINIMKNNNYLITHTSYKIINENNRNIGLRIARDFYEISDLIYSCDIGLSTVIINKKILKGDNNFPNLKTKEDFILWLNFLKKNVKIIGIDKKLAYWRKLKNSLSSSTIQKLFDGFKLYYIYMNYSFLRSIFSLFILSINFLIKK